MKKFLRIRITLLLACLMTSATAVEDYVWTTPSFNSSESMPLGGGDIGMNVWVDALTNEVNCLVSQSGCFDENNTLLKFGRLRIQLPDRFERLVEQRLCVGKGSMLIRFDQTEMELWVDVWKPVIHIEANQPIIVAYDSWREHDTPLDRFICQESSWKWAVPKGCYTLHDSIQRNDDGTVTAWHQNQNDTLFRHTLRQQGMLQFADSIYNPIKGRIFGGMTRRLTEQHWVVVLCNQQSSLDEWQSQLNRTYKAIRTQKDRKATRNWWWDFWQRSFVVSNGRASEALRNYALFRYMMGCNAHPARQGERWPTKFNGGLFTFDPADCDSVMAQYKHDKPDVVTPDYRRWGGGVHTAQNQRLLYWPMLQTGDWDALQCQLDFYTRTLPAAELRSRHYWQHGGACFTEQMENFGLPNPAEYGKHKDGGDPGVEDNRWLEYEWDTALEFAEMYCLYPFASSPYGRKEAARQARTLIMSCLRFFDEHYATSDSIGHKIIFPGSGCETYKIARNPSSTIAALMRVSADALAHRDDLSLSDADVAWLERFRATLPPLPTRQQRGHLCIAPAESWERRQNVESPQLYPVWPWRVVADSLAINTYLHDSIALANRNYVGWKQDNIWAAMVGKTEEAWTMTLQKLVVNAPAERSNLYRFPAFWGPGYDWMPDHNWGGSAMIGLHAMLMQEDDEGNIKLLPAWPRDEDVHFRLWASGHRQVEVIYRNGRIEKYTINGKAQRIAQ